MARLRNKQRHATRAGMHLPFVQSALARAHHAEQAGDWETAANLTCSVLAVRPEHLEALYLASVAALRLGRAQEARELLERGIGVNASLGVFHGQMGTVLRTLGKLDEAAASHRRALTLEPLNPDYYNNLGNALLDSGKVEEAAACYAQGLEIQAGNAALLHNLAHARRGLGQVEQAITGYQEALAIQPNFPEALLHLADTLREHGRPAEACGWYEKLLALQPDLALGHLNFGIALQSDDKLEEAARCYRRVLEIQPDFAQAYNNLGNVLRLQKKYAEAVAPLEKAVELAPLLPEPHGCLGSTFQALERLDEALRCFDRVLELKPDDLSALTNAGNVCSAREDFPRAVEYYQRACASKPDFVEAHNNLGNAVRGLGRYDEAAECFRQAVAIEPGFADGYSNLGNVLKDLALFPESLAAYEKAIELKPDNAGYKWNRSLLDLTWGELERGWEGYEYGFACQQRMPERPCSQPRWQGESLTGKTILTWSEQGVGDEIMFANSIPDLAAAADHCVVECDVRLVPLFARSFPDCEVLARRIDPPDGRTTWPDIDLQSPMGSLARWLRPSANSFPRDRGYLAADPARVEYWRKRLQELGGGLKVGISWRSRVMTANRAKFYAPLEQWGPILQTPGAQFISLQYCNYEEDLAEAQRRFGIHVHRFEDLNVKDELDDVAALVTALDLVVTGGNINMTLGGALNRETWVFSIYGHMDWVNLGTDYAPWFPSVRLFDRTWSQRWEPVVQSMAAELRNRCRG